MKNLALLAGFAALLFWGPSMACQQQTPPQKEHRNPTVKSNPLAPSNLPSSGNPSLPAQHAQRDPSKGKDTAEEEPLPRFERPEWVIIYITAIYVLFSGFMWLAMRRQVTEMANQRSLMVRSLASLREQSKILKASVAEAKRSADIADSSAKTYQMTERAWMTYTRFEHGRITNNDNDRKDFYFKIFWKNTGRSPAINALIITQAQVVEDLSKIPEFAPDPAPDGMTRHAPLIPGVEVHSHITVTQDAIEKLKMRKVRVFLFGRCDYNLVTSLEMIRRTEACIEITFAGFDPESRPLFAYSPNGRQNSAT